jgi:hypothetical protein
MDKIPWSGKRTLNYFVGPDHETLFEMALKLPQIRSKTS